MFLVHAIYLALFLVVALASHKGKRTCSALEEPVGLDANALVVVRIKEALASPLLQGSLPSIYTSLLRIAATEVYSEGSLLKSLVHNYLFDEENSADARFWQDLIDTSFREFAQLDKEQAHRIIEYNFISPHPFSTELRKSFTIDSFLKGPVQSLSSFLESIISESFNDEFSSLMKINEPPQNSQRRLFMLLHKYQQTHSQNNKELKYICSFLTNLGAEQIAQHPNVLLKDYDFYHRLSDFSLSLYRAMQCTEMALLAQNALRKVLPSVHDSLDQSNRTYQNVISAYVASGQEPFSQEVFRELLIKCAQSSPLIRQLSPEYVTILNAFEQNREESQVCDALFDHFRWCWDPQNPDPPLGDPSYLQNVLDQSMHRLAQTDPEKAQKIIDQVIVANHPFYDEIKGQVKVSCFSDPSNQPLWRFFRSITDKAAGKEWSRILPINTVEQAHETQALLSRFKRAFSFYDPSLKYVCAFLMNISFKWTIFMGILSTQIKCKDALVMPSRDVTFHSHLCKLSREIYDHMEQKSSGQAQEAFSRLLRQPYEKGGEKSYDDMMERCMKSGIEPANPAEIRLLVTEALKDTQLVSSLSHVIRSIMGDFAQNAEHSRIFFDHLCESDPFREIKFEKDTASFWAFVISRAFWSFALDSDHKQRAHELIENAMISSYSLFQQLYIQDPFIIDEFVRQMFTDSELAENWDLDCFVEEAAQRAFHVTFSRLLGKLDAEAQFILLIQNYSQVMFSHPLWYKYSYAFLMHVGIEQIRLAIGNHGLLQDGFLVNPHELSAYIYKRMTSEDALPGQCRKARMALENVLPSVYESHRGKPYKDIISAYVASHLEARDLAYLKKLGLEALQYRQISKILIGNHASLLAGSSKESHIFLCYVLQNYQLPDVRAKNNMQFWWRSLTFSSIHNIAQTMPELFLAILKEPIVSFDPFSRDLPQENLSFSQGLFHSVNLVGFLVDLADFLKMAADWGHTHTAALILKKAQGDVRAENAGEALQYAAQNGHFEIVRLLLSSRPDIIFKDAGEALQLAAQNGHLEIFRLLINTRSDIAFESAGMALVLAAKNGHLEILTATLDKFDGKISAFDIIEAHYSAVAKGYKEIVISLLNTCPNISPGYYRRALIIAAESGYFTIFELLLEWRGATVTTTYAAQILLWIALNDKDVISTLGIDWHNCATSVAGNLRALSRSAFSGYAAIATLLLERLDAGLASDESLWTILYATKNTERDMIEALMKTPKPMDPTVAGWALVGASLKGHAEIVKVLLKEFGTTIRSDDAGMALRWAANKGNSDVYTLLTDTLRGVISGGDAGAALSNASIKGHTAIVVRLINDYGSEIIVRDFDFARNHALLWGHIEIAKLISARPQ